MLRRWRIYRYMHKNEGKRRSEAWSTAGRAARIVCYRKAMGQ